MLKYLKFIAVFITCYTFFAVDTSYINGIDEDYGSPTTIRKDVLRIGTAGHWGFNGMAAPSGQVNSTTTIWNLLIVDACGGNPTANQPATSPSTYPNTLTDLWINGDATYFSNMIWGSIFGLPSPVANVGGASSVPVNIHFLLSHSPNSIPLAWFTQAVPNYTRIIIEPGSADPGIDSILSDITTSGVTNTSLLIGSPITLAAAITTVTPAVQRHPKVFANYAYSTLSGGITKAQLTLNADTTFSSTVHGISLVLGSTPALGATPTVSFTNSSSIVDLNTTANANTATFGTFTVAAGRTLTMVGINQSIPTAVYNLTTSGNLTSVTALTNVIATCNATTGALTATVPSSSTAIPALPITATTTPVISWVH